MTLPRVYRDEKQMEADTRLWEEHPTLTSYKNYFDAKTGEPVARIVTYHKLVEEWDDVSMEMKMVPMYSTTLEPPKPKAA